MNQLIEFIMGESTKMDITVAIRLAIVFAIISMIKSIIVAMIRGAKE